MKYTVLLFLLILTEAVQSQDIEVAVHRGGNRWAPENTLPAAHFAASLGGDYLEIDVRQNKEGIFFNFHDDTVDRTTDGSGDFYSKTYDEIKALDAGSWFRHSFAGIQVPTVKEVVDELKGKIKFYFDFKYGDIEEFIELIREWGVAEDCFFTLQPKDLAVVHRAGLDFKVNVSTVEELIAAHDQWNLSLVEVRAHDLSDELLLAAHQRNVKVMVYVPGDQYTLYRHCLQYDIDRINLDNPDVFRYMEKNDGKYPEPQYIMHRGGIVNHQWTEYHPHGIQAAIDRQVGGLEFDIRETNDGHLVVHHDASLKKIFGVDKWLADLSLKELKELTSIKGNYNILTLDEYLSLLPSDILLMPDLKAEYRDREFYEKLQTALEKRHSLSNCVFIKDEARDYFWGKARFKVLTDEIPRLYEEWRAGKDVACHYFLFDNGNRPSIPSIRLAQKMSMDIITPVNTFHYKNENVELSGKRDIHFGQSLGIRWFQVDGVFVD
ncbi:glycerophosphodiester phosphodiesterase family protein [Membranihabitans marinus]|uniref:glycerophosphodiester phosphodiesterase family protein n=1 Tax=Membranihabitans marinus TaxID=1227546 RepID=UPI001F3C8BCD|nr:glycerophosphodiester phosphodiesterase family protein [Membranihabitans marinus]